MTGRDLILYILENKLEDSPVVIKDGKLLALKDLNIETKNERE